MAQKDAFIGTWQIDETQSRYTFDDPPVDATYQIAPHDNGYTFTMAWQTIDGEDMRMVYYATPDGRDIQAIIPLWIRYP